MSSFLSRHPITIPFPQYILPSLPFRRKASTDSTASAASTSSTSSQQTSSIPDPSSESTVPTTTLSNPVSYIRCIRCAAELCLTDQIVSRGFTGRFGRAYLVAPHDAFTARASASNPIPALPNTNTLKAVPRQLVTGAHTVSDMICANCGVGLGWKYVNAEDESQRYKIGKFILETKRISTGNRWEEEYDGDSGRETGLGVDARIEQIMTPSVVDGMEVEFDSQDEDECEDLFLGQWTPEGAAKRRKLRRFMKS